MITYFKKNKSFLVNSVFLAVLGLLIVSGTTFFSSPTTALADSFFSYCDNSNTGTGGGQRAGEVNCPGTIGASYTLYGVELQVANNTSGPFYLWAGDMESGTTGIATTLVGTIQSGTGFLTVIFTSPKTYLSNSRPFLIVSSSNTSVSGATPNFTTYGYGVPTNQQYQIWYWQPIVDLNNTSIISVTPYNGQYVATSTTFTFGVTGYLTEEDFLAGNNTIRLNLSYTQSAFANYYAPVTVATCRIGFIPNPEICGAFEWTLSSSGFFSVSTTTLMDSEIGRYRMSTEISRKRLWILNQTLSATSTSFTVVEASGLNILGDSIAEQFNSLNASTTLSLATCNPLGNFDISACAYGLIVPPVDVLGDMFGSLYNGTLNRVPMGYITRFVTILSNFDGAVMPPALSYSFGSSSPQVLQNITENDPVEFQIYEHFDVLEDIRTDDSENKNIWDIVMPYFNMIVAFAVLFVMLYDLFGFELQIDKSTHYNATTTTRVVNGRRTTSSTFEKTKSVDIDKHKSL